MLILVRRLEMSVLTLVIPYFTVCFAVSRCHLKAPFITNIIIRGQERQGGGKGRLKSIGHGGCSST